MHEARLWPSSLFVTLTYNNESLPEHGTLELRDVQLFLKRLRKRFNHGPHNPLRYFLGGEYGGDTGRPHYHSLLFNCALPDARYAKANKRGEPLYTSAVLDDVWQLGQCWIGAVTLESAQYCAKYSMKKIVLSDASTPEAIAEYEARYLIFDPSSGEVLLDRKPEFAVMSRRPGIGRGYYEKFGQEVRDHDNVVAMGVKHRPPRYYDQRSKLVDPELFEQVRKARKRLAVTEANKLDNTPGRLRVKEQLLLAAVKKKDHGL